MSDGPEPPTTDAEPAAEEPCLVPGCQAPSVRRLARVGVAKVFPDLPERGRRAPLCREHYRAWKKATRERRQLDRLGR
jgi:hypothetical protein